jgi:hypothetical protein
MSDSTLDEMWATCERYQPWADADAAAYYKNRAIKSLNKLMETPHEKNEQTNQTNC